MKNKNIIIIINFLVIVFSVGAIVLNLIQCEYFTQMVFSLSFVSAILLIISILFIRDSDKKLRISISEPKTNKKAEEETIEKVEAEENNHCLELVDAIDKTLPIEQVFELKFQKLSAAIELVAGLAYVVNNNILQLKSTYALLENDLQKEIIIGSGLTGEVAKSGIPIVIDIDEQIDIEVISGLGKSKPNFLYILPIYKKKKIFAVIELATYKKLTENRVKFLIEAFEK